MRSYLIRYLVGCLCLAACHLGYASPWGKEYFPNTELINHRGETVHFFDDLVDGKVVAINFIYTSCADVCPLETAQLTRVQKILGDRVGKDVFFYSISIDPEHDTPEVLSEYRKRFKARWDFFTGNKAEIVNLRRKLGLYVEGVDDGPNKNNHNVSMIIGNQASGRWMTRSPFENPYVLADQIGNWLNGWKLPQQERDYASAPDLRPLQRGETLFRTRCGSCHSAIGSDTENNIGPDLYGVTRRREQQWLVNWLQAPDKMVEAKDPLALALVEQYDGLVMPNLRLNQQEMMDLIDYMANLPAPELAPATLAGEDRVAVMNAWVREAPPGAPVHGGYMVLINVGDASLELVGATSPDFSSVEFHEMSMEDGIMSMRALPSQTIGPGEKLKFVPGGKHLMLHDARRVPKQGDSTRVVLEFADGSTQSLSLPVKR